jgi:hypothetical protein
MDLVQILNSLNSLSPLAVIGGMGYIIYLLVKNRGSVRSIQTNHLHELPEMAATLRRIEDRLESMNDNVVYIRARINGK